MSASAIAAPEDSKSVEQIVVTAPLLHSLKKVPVGNGHMVYDIAWRFKNVSYADLDLAKAADAKKLETRVGQTANELCGALKAEFPETAYALVEPQNCAKTATDEAMVVVKALVTASAK